MLDEQKKCSCKIFLLTIEQALLTLVLRSLTFVSKEMDLRKLKKATIINDFAPSWESLGGHMAKKKAKKATKKAAKKATKKKATKKH